MTTLAAEVQDLSEQLIAYQDAVAEVVKTLGHQGNTPTDLRDAVAQITDRLLRGRDLDTPLTGTAEVVRAMLIYAHLGAWFFQGMTRQPILGEKATPELLTVLNSKPSPELIQTLLRPSTPDGLAYIAEFLEMFDRNRYTEGENG
jgi:hypothetical protein